jgi:cytochrome c556
MDDFRAKLGDFRREAAKLADVAGSGDQKAIMEQFKATGGTCKACHDEYKAKDYIN